MLVHFPWGTQVPRSSSLPRGPHMFRMVLRSPAEEYCAGHPLVSELGNRMLEVHSRAIEGYILCRHRIDTFRL